MIPPFFPNRDAASQSDPEWARHEMECKQGEEARQLWGRSCCEEWERRIASTTEPFWRVLAKRRAGCPFGPRIVAQYCTCEGKPTYHRWHAVDVLSESHYTADTAHELVVAIFDGMAPYARVVAEMFVSESRVN